MTWIDERLFGWSKSSRRGTSAWGGNATAVSSVEASRVGSPDISDDEDHGDYDNVIGYLPSIFSSPVARQPGSLRGSFADLPSVRSRENLAPLKPQPSSPMLTMNAHLSPFVPSDGSGGLTHRTPGQRQRKASLSGNVPVERIGRIDHDETFKEATEVLNQENEARRKAK
jgi:glycerol-3-phosphate O-acyltransferase/dihydroxyacetone phosphate acyltransferase